MFEKLYKVFLYFYIEQKIIDRNEIHIEKDVLIQRYIYHKTKIPDYLNFGITLLSAIFVLQYFLFKFLFFYKRDLVFFKK